MTLPTPQAGLVIRYSYLWRNEADQGREEGVKDRPCVVILAVENVKGTYKVHVAPITHTAPHESSTSLEIPIATKYRLGLDDARSWINTRETNIFTWPGPDVRPVDRSNHVFTYGFLPANLFRHVRDEIIANIRSKRAQNVERDE